MNGKRLNIIARYNEDITWVKDLKGDVLVYNKGENYIWDFPKIDAENYGRESETYVRAIIENYDKLDQYDEFALMQGHPFDHCSDILERLEHNTSTYTLLSTYYANHILPKDDYIFYTHKNIVDLLFQQMKTDHEVGPIKQVTNISYMMEHNNKVFIEKAPEIKQIIYVLMILGIQYRGLNITWGCGAQYIVSTDLLKNKSIWFWKNLHELLRYTYVELESQDLGYVMERLWPLIWSFADKIGNWKIT